MIENGKIFLVNRVAYDDIISNYIKGNTCSYMPYAPLVARVVKSSVPVVMTVTLSHFDEIP